MMMPSASSLKPVLVALSTVLLVMPLLAAMSCFAHQTSSRSSSTGLGFVASHSSQNQIDSNKEDVITLALNRHPQLEGLFTVTLYRLENDAQSRNRASQRHASNNNNNKAMAWVELLLDTASEVTFVRACSPGTFDGKCLNVSEFQCTPQQDPRLISKSVDRLTLYTATLEHICDPSTSLALGSLSEQSEPRVGPKFPTDSGLYVATILQGQSNDPLISGSLGLQYFWQKEPASFMSFLGATLPKSRVFSLDLSGSPFPTLSIGDQGDQSVEWGERQLVWNLQPRAHLVTMFSLSICNVRLFSNYSSNWPNTIVDSAQSCLGLPDPFFQMVMSWIPLAGPCDDVYSNSSVRCRVDTLEHLPSISFRVSESGTDLVIPLRLLVNESDMSLCIVPTGPVHHSFSQFRYPQPPIVLGTRVLSAFQVFFDMDDFKVGFKQKSSSDAVQKTDNPICAPHATCIGEQSFYAPGNTCIDPQCSAYHFMEVSPITKKCRVNQAFVLMITMFVLFLGLFDLWYHEAYSRVISRLRGRRPSSRR